MSRQAIPGGKRRGQGQGAGAIKEVLNSLAFLDKPGPHIAREHLPRAAQSVEGLVHELQCLDEVLRRWLVIFSLGWHPHSPDFRGRASGRGFQTNNGLTKKARRRELGSRYSPGFDRSAFGPENCRRTLLGSTRDRRSTAS
jgi:hypothetical protein